MTSTIKNTLPLQEGCSAVRDLIFEHINDKYAWGNYGEFKVLMMRENGYINVTKLCKDGDKEFRFWRRLDTANNFLEEVSSIVRICTTDLLITVKGGDKKLQMVTGTYAHPDLVPHIASWVSASFAIKVSRIVNEYFVKEEKEKILRLEFEKSDLAKRLNESDRKYEESKRKADEERKKAEEHRLKMERKADEDRRKADEDRRKADEEYRKAEERYQAMCKRYGFQEDKLDIGGNQTGNG